MAGPRTRAHSRETAPMRTGASRPSRPARPVERPSVTTRRVDRDPTRPVYVISVAASIVNVHPRTLRIYEDEGLVCPARTPTNIRLYSEKDIRRVLWIRHLTRDRGVNPRGPLPGRDGRGGAAGRASRRPRMNDHTADEAHPRVTRYVDGRTQR